MKIQRTDKERFAKLKAILTERRREIAAELNARIANPPIPESLEDRLCAEDQAEVDIQGDIELSVIRMKSETLRKIDQALVRLERGTYGNCIDCREEIKENRLRALYFAVSCKECEEKHEVEERQRRERHGRISERPVFYDV